MGLTVAQSKRNFGRKVEKPETICNAFNEYFSSVSDSLMQDKMERSVADKDTEGYKKIL
jgi:hypothetical protein